MRSTTTAQFRRLFRSLPKHVRSHAEQSYKLFHKDPFHKSLQFKKVNNKKNVWSARVGIAYRAMAVRDGDLVNWYWIGSHADYDKLV